MNEDGLYRRLREVTKPHESPDFFEYIGATVEEYDAMLANRTVSSLTLTLAAEYCQADEHWIVSGEPDPLTVAMVGEYPSQRTGGENAYEKDQFAFNAITLAYKQAFPTFPVNGETPPRTVLRPVGVPSFSHFTEAVEKLWAVDVVSLPELITDKVFHVAGRWVIMVQSTLDWGDYAWRVYRGVASVLLARESLAVRGKYCAVPVDYAEELVTSLVYNPIVAKVVEDGAEYMWAELGWYYMLPSAVLSADRRIPQLTDRSLMGVLLDSGVPMESISSRMSEASSRRIPPVLITAQLDAFASRGATLNMFAWLLGVTVHNPAHEVLFTSPTTRNLLAKLDDILPDLSTPEKREAIWEEARETVRRGESKRRKQRKLRRSIFGVDRGGENGELPESSTGF